MGFFERILAFFRPGNNPEALKKKRLRQLVKALGQNKYGKFYRAKSEELEPALAAFFLDLYKFAAPVRVFLAHAAQSARLKQMVMDVFLDDDLKALEERLSAGSIQERAAAVPAEDLAASVRRDLASFMGAFDITRLSRVDNCYDTIISLVNFVGFDFFLVLKKFDPAMSERSPGYQPKFRPVRAAELKEKLKDFIEYSAAVEVDRDWKIALEVLKLYKDGMEILNPGQWAKLIRLLKDISRVRILEQIVQHAEKNPLWQSAPRPPDEQIAGVILDAKKAEVEEALNKVQNDKRNAQIEELAKTIFGAAEVVRLENYTGDAGEVFYKKHFAGFTKVAGLNYLKAFLIDFFKREISELCNLFLVRGQWLSNTFSQPMSNAFHELTDLLDQLAAFDDSLADKGEHGSRLRQALSKADRDKGQARYVTIILDSVNNRAQRMINTASRGFAATGKCFKSLIEDFPRKPPELIMNWRELESASISEMDMPLVKRLAASHERIYRFTQLLQFFIEPVDEEAD